VSLLAVKFSFLRLRLRHFISTTKIRYWWIFVFCRALSSCDQHRRLNFVLLVGPAIWLSVWSQVFLPFCLHIYGFYLWFCSMSMWLSSSTWCKYVDFMSCWYNCSKIRRDF